MRRGQHAADDGSFGRSAGGAMARGIALIAVAVVLGVILLRATDSEEPFRAVQTEDDAGDEGTTPTTGGSDVTAPTTTPVSTAHDPSQVTVLVANGARINGLASKISDQLKGANYVVAAPDNTKELADASMVYFTPGYEADAAAIAALLSPAPATAALPDPPPVDDMKGAHVLVVAAADLDNASG